MDDTGVICACFNFTMKELRRRQAEEPGLSFESLMVDTGAGTKCTACLLDLEYHFVTGARTHSPSATSRPAAAPRRSLKRRIYDFVDGLSPKRSTVSRTVAPVIAGNGLDEFLWIANHPLLYAKDGRCAPTHLFDVAVRNPEGKVIFSEQLSVAPAQSVRVDIAAPLRRAAGAARPFAHGMLQVEARSAEPGFRGTTRPQIEIVAGQSACAVHTQAASPRAGDGALTVACRPSEERIFLVHMNPSAESRNVNVKYPLGNGVPAITEQIVVPAYGASLYELDLERAAGVCGGGPVMGVSWHADGPHKCYFLCGTPNLDRFSVDHA